MMTHKQKETHASLRNVFLHDSGLLGNMDTAQAISREHEMHREDLQANLGVHMNRGNRFMQVCINEQKILSVNQDKV